MVVAEVCARTAANHAQHDFAAFPENDFLDIGFRAGFVTDIGHVVVTAVVEMLRIVRHVYLAQSVTCRAVRRYPHIDAVHPFPYMTEDVLDAVIAVYLNLLYRRIIFRRHGVFHFSRSVSQAVRIPARDERIVSVKVAPLRPVKCCHPFTQSALGIPVAVLSRFVRLLRVERRILDDEQPVQVFPQTVRYLVPFRASALAVARVFAEVGA